MYLPRLYWTIYILYYHRTRYDYLIGTLLNYYIISRTGCVNIVIIIPTYKVYDVRGVRPRALVLPVIQ